MNSAVRRDSADAEVDVDLLRARLAELETRFDDAVQAAKLQALYNFAYGISHMINNPLANIATRAQTLLPGETDPERRKKLTTINQQAFRAHEMIADLMLFARPPRLKLQPVDLAQLADQVVADMQPLAAQQGTQLLRGDETGPLMLAADAGQLGVAIKAIVQNSLEALRQGGQIEIDARLDADHAALRSPAIPAPHFQAAREISNPQSTIRNPQFQLSITDSGPGIPPEHLPHLFDPYFSGREAGRGLGLGLSKAWRIVEQHAGTITAESPREGGARLTIWLPADA
jgi:signal transduction histidine kinase